MATIELRKTKDGEVRYRALIRFTGHPTLSRTFERKTDAKNWVRDTEAEIRSGRFKTVSQPRHTLSELVDRYVEEALPGKPAVAGLYRMHLLWWRKELGSYFLRDLTSELIQPCYERLMKVPGVSGRPRSATTANRYLISLSSCLTYGRKRLKWIERNPVSDVERQQEPKGRVRFLTRPSDEENCELDRLLRACKLSLNPDLYDLVVLGLWTGCREGELMSLRRSYIRLNEQGFILPAEVTKTKTERFVPLVGPALEVVERRLQTASDYLMAGRERKNSKQPPAFPRRAWNTVLRVAGIKNFRFHDLRHTHASYLAMSGSTERELMEALGHVTTAMASRYAHLSNGHKLQVTKRLQSSFGDWKE